MLDIDLGFDHLISALDWSGSTRISCRVFGINAPELSTAAGKTARDFAKTLLPVGASCSVTSHGWDKYGGRFDGTIMLSDGRDFAAVMVASGNAVPFMVGLKNVVVLESIAPPPKANAKAKRKR